MFDTSNEIQTSIRRADGVRNIVVRWPTDEQWLQRSRSWHINVQRRGRGVSETQVESARADSTLYVQIRQEDSPDLEVDEAAKIIEILARCDITDVSLEMDEATVTMTVLGDTEVRHRLKLPTTAQVTQFKRSSVRVMDMPHGRQQLRTNMQAGLDLYTKCAVGVEGYANGSIPSIHRDAAIRAVIDACEAEAEAAKGEDF